MDKPFLQTQSKDPSLYNKTICGAGWVFIGRVFQQLIAIIKISVLAHLLSPRDFGVLALAYLTKSVLEVFTRTGFETSLIQKKTDISGDLNTVWTVNVFRGICLFVLIFVLSPYAVQFFDGSGTFTESHITNPEAITRQFTDPESPLSAQLETLLTEEEKSKIITFQTMSDNSWEQKRFYANLFDRWVTEKDLSGISFLRELGMSPYAQRLLAHNETGIRLNRLLLESVFQYEIQSVILDKSEITLIFRIIGICFILAGFRNVALVYLSKELEFKPLFYFQLIQQILGAITVVVLVVIFRSVWALVWGALFESLVNCVFSYIIIPFKPKYEFCRKKITELWSFGKHIFGISVLDYVLCEGDDIIVGKVLGPMALGHYRYAYRLSDAVASEIGNVISKSTFPTVSKIQDKYEKLQSAYRKTTLFVSLSVFPVSTFIFLFTNDIVFLLLGQEWLPIVPAIKFLCILGLLKCIQTRNIFWATGRPDIPLKLSIIRLVLMLVLIFPLSQKFNILGTSIAMLACTVVVYPFLFYYLKKQIRIGFVKTFQIVFVPLSAVLLTVIPSVFINRCLPRAEWSVLGLKFSVFILFYFVGLFGFSHLLRNKEIVSIFTDIYKALIANRKHDRSSENNHQ